MSRIKLVVLSTTKCLCKKSLAIKLSYGINNFSNSFRPFFIAAGIWATLAVPFLAFVVILVILIGTDNFNILLWHQHEMLLVLLQQQLLVLFLLQFQIGQVDYQ